MRLEEAREFALSLPETSESPHFEKSSFRVKGKIFATVPSDGDHLHVLVDEEETRAAVAEYGAACEELWWGKRLAGLRVTLSAAEGTSVRELIEDAWRRKAPRTVVAEFDSRNTNRWSRGIADTQQDT